MGKVWKMCEKEKAKKGKTEEGGQEWYGVENCKRMKAKKLRRTKKESTSESAVAKGDQKVVTIEQYESGFC